MVEWQTLIDLAAGLALTGLGWASGRRSVRKKLGAVLGALGVEELASKISPALAPALAPLVSKSLRPQVVADMRQVLADELDALAEGLRKTMAVQRAALLEDVKQLLRAEGA